MTNSLPFWLPTAMLVKRPLIIGDDFVLVGFKEAEWERLK